MICQLNISDKFKSANFDKRKKKISFIIIHYTETKTLQQAVSLLTDSKRKVSCHYLIDTDGKIFNLVKLESRAWHAGDSRWKNFTDLNSHSIGIEIVYPGEKSNSEYNQEQIKALVNLMIFLKKKYKINNNRILGHSDIAPLRKIDPGKFFPWEKLNKFSLGLWVKTREDFTDLNKSQYLKFLKNLNDIGYRYISSKTNNKKVIDSFHRHHLPSLVGFPPNKSSLLKSEDILNLKKID